MDRRRTAGGALLAAGLLAVLAFAEDPAEPGLAWRSDLEAARAEARTTGRPMLVVFR